MKYDPFNCLELGNHDTEFLDHLNSLFELFILFINEDIFCAFI